jgi:hypothetical protein
VEVVVSLSGASASLDSEVRHGAGEAELAGVIDALPPTTAAATFTAAGKTVVTNASTVFVKGSVTGTFADLRLHMRVEVKGTLSGDTLTATRVEIEDGAAPVPGPVPGPGPAPPNPAPEPNPEPTEAEFSGIISGLTGAASAFQFNVGSRVVKGDATTAIIGDSNATKTFADLKNGATVEVKGVQMTGFVQASRIHIEGGAAEPAEAEFSGILSGLTGAASAFQFNVGSRVVKGDATTAIIGDSNATKTFADLKNGATVEVKGVQMTGFVQASRIHIEGAEAEPPTDDVDVEGTLGAVTGACPAIASTVGSTKFTTSASTRFDDAACTAFKSGDKVEVSGAKQADGSIAATRLKKK